MAANVSLLPFRSPVDDESDPEVVPLADTGYSEKGVEMDVYAPTNDPLVLFAGPSDDGDAIRELVEEPGAPTATGA